MITVTDRESAFEIAYNFYSHDFSKDEIRSAGAGYPVFAMDGSYYDYICDLGNRLECNFSNGRTINVWINDIKNNEIEKNKKIKELFENVLSNGLNEENMRKMFNMYKNM